MDTRDIGVQLPNLDDPSLARHIIAVDKRSFLGIGTTLRGRFGENLPLHLCSTCGDTVDVLLEILTGLHFTEMAIGGRYKCLFSTVK